MESQLAKLASKYRVNLEGVYVPPSNHLVHWSERLHMRRRAHIEIYWRGLHPQVNSIFIWTYTWNVTSKSDLAWSCMCHACVLVKAFRYIIADSLLYTIGRMNTDENICGKNSRPCRQENHHHFGGACGHAFSIGAWGASDVELPVPPASTENNQSFQDIVTAALREAATSLNVWRKESFEDLGMFGVCFALWFFPYPLWTEWCDMTCWSP